MGLDMYLKATRSFYGSDEDKKAIDIKAMFPEMFDSGNMNTLDIGFEVGYWRKANAIHNWFVKTCQDDNDDCRSSYVNRKQLELLKAICQEELKAKDNPEASEGELEPKEGFFFGSYEKDEWYYGALEETIKIVTKCLELPEDWGFEYQSSW